MPPPPTKPRKLARRYHLHPPGLLYIGITVILGIGAVNSQNNLLFVVFGVALGALIFSGVLSGAMLMGVSVERRTPLPGVVGLPCRFTYTVRNANRFVPAIALTISELPDARDVPRARRWTRLIERPTAFVAQVGPRRSITVHCEGQALRRGAAGLRTVVISSSFPFGVFRKSIRFLQADQLIVAPAPRPLAPDIFRAVQARSRFTEHSISRRGRGDEFFGLRDYVRGDSPRFIDWKSSARTGALVTRLTAEHAASELRVLLLLDPAAPRGVNPDTDPNERVITLAASIMEAALERAMHVGLAVPQAGLALAPAHSPRQRQGLQTALALIDLTTITNALPSDLPPPFALAGPNLVIAPSGARHALAPADVPALGVDALARWGADRPDPAHAPPPITGPDAPSARGVA